MRQLNYEIVRKPLKDGEELPPEVEREVGERIIWVIGTFGYMWPENEEIPPLTITVGWFARYADDSVYMIPVKECGMVRDLWGVYVHVAENDGCESSFVYRNALGHYDHWM